MYQRSPSRGPLKTRAPSGASMPQNPTPADGRKPPNGIIDSVGAEQDRDQVRSQQEGEVPRASEGDERAEKDQGIRERHIPDPRAEDEVQTAPHDRDRQ